MKKYFLLLAFIAALPALAPADDRYEPNPNPNYYIIVDKSDNTLTVYDQIDWVIQYPCTFGSDDLSDKMYEGDRRTPEGSFTITTKGGHKKWHKMMKINYPTAADYEKFNKRKAAGLIPANARIGGDIAIHGTWPREEFAVENLQNWTLGCVSMRNDHIDELFTMVGIGTKVIIRK